MKTFTAIRRSDRASIKLRARSNRHACQAAAAHFGHDVEFRVLQSGYGFDSGWQQWASVYRQVCSSVAL